MKNADMPVIPSMLKAGDMARSEGGLTKREYFAGIAMGRVIAQDKNGVMGPDITAAAAVILADALLAELDKEET